MKSINKIVVVLLIFIIIIFPLFSIFSNAFNPIFINSINDDLNFSKNAYSESTATEWWNTSWLYRYEIGLTEPIVSTPINISERIDEPIDIYLTFPDDQTCINDSIRVVYFDGNIWSNEIPCQVWNETYYTGNTYLSSCNVFFFMNISQGEQETYYIYYNQSAPIPNYSQLIWINAYNDASKTDDTTNPDVINTLGQPSQTNCDTINISTSLGTMAQIELIDTLNMNDRLSGPVCSLITLKYFTYDALRYNPSTVGSGGQFFVINDFALDDNGGSNEVDWQVYYEDDPIPEYLLITPDNPSEATNGKVQIEENGTLFVRLRIDTDDGGYNYTEISGSRHNETGCMNFTIYYNFYFYKNHTFVTVDDYIYFQQNCYTKNWGQWPHIFGIMSDNAAFEQDRRTWNGSITQFPNDTFSSSRKDYPYEPWVATYDADESTKPSIGIINLNITLGYEVASQEGDGGYQGRTGCFANGETLIYQPVVVQGHQGDYYLLPQNTYLNLRYAVLTTDQADNYTKIREFAFRLNNPIDISVGPVEEFENNVIVLNAIDRDGVPISSANVYLLNATTKAILKSGITDSNGNYTFTSLLDGNYDVSINYTIQSKIFNVNYSSLSLDHFVQRVYYEQYNCTVARFLAHVVDADDQGNLVNAKVRLGNGTIGPDLDKLIFEGFTNSSGYYSMRLITGFYTINISYGGVDSRINNLTQPVKISNQATGTMVIGCVVNEVKTDVVLLNSNATYNSLLGRYECYVNESVYFNLNYTDVDNNEGINDANQSDWSILFGTELIDTGMLTENIEDGNYTFFYNTISLNASSNYVLYFEFDKNYPSDYIYAFKQLNLYINPYPTTFTTSDLASFNIPWGDNFSIHTFLNDSYLVPGTPLSDASINIVGWDPSYYSISASGGTYNISFNSTNYASDDTLSIEISATKTNFSSSSLFFTINMEERDSYFYEGPVSAVPYNNDSTIDIYFEDLDNNTIYGFDKGITNNSGALKILLLNPYSYSVANLGDGHYQLTVDGLNNLSIGSHSLYLAADWFGAPYYSNRTLTINQIIEPIDTSFITNYQGIIPFGNYQNITVRYEVTDPDSSQYGNRIDGADVNITGLTYGTDYYVNSKGNGYYDIIILNASLPMVTDYIFTINATKLNYTSIEREVAFSVRKLRTFFLVDPIGIIPFGEDVEITLNLKISDSASYYNDGKAISGLTKDNFTIYNASGVMPPSTYEILDLSSGKYKILLYNSSFEADLNFELNISISLNSTLRDTNKNVTFLVRKIFTGLSANPITDVPYGNSVNATLHCIIEDAESGRNNIGITGLTTANFSIGSGWQIDALIALGTAGDYLLTFSNMSVVNIQNYQVNLTYLGNQTINSDIFELDFNYRKLNTLLINDPVLPISWNVTFSIIIHFSVDDSESILNNAGVNNSIINCSIDTIPLTADQYSVTFNGNGEYNLTINGSVIPYVKTYDIQINASHENIDIIFENASYTFSFDTKSHDTSFIYDPVLTTPHLDNVTIRVTYWDIISNIGIDNSSGDVRMTCIVSGTSIQYWIEDQSNGEYDILINSTNLDFTSYTAEINVSYISGNLYVNRSIPINPGITFEIVQVNTFYSCSFNTSNTQIIESSYSDWPWSVNLSIYVSYIDLDHADQFIYPSFLNVSGNYEFENGGNYSVYDYSNGTYEIEVNTTAVLNLTRTFRMDFTLFTNNNPDIDSYIHQNFSIIFTIRKPLTRLDLDSNTIEVPWNDNATIYATYINTEEKPELKIADANINLNCTVAGSSTYKSYTINDWISWKELDSTPGVYNLTLNTSWVDVDQLDIKVDVAAEHPQTQKATNFFIVSVRFIYINLEFIDGTTEIESETDDYFLAEFRLSDIDHGVNVTNNSISAYENITFYCYYNGLYNLTGWQYGNFTVNSLGYGLYKFNFTFIEGTIIEDYDLRIKVNASRLKGFQTADGLAEATPFYTITIRLRRHTSGITINRTSELYGNPLFPRVSNLPAATFINGNETIKYGENINVTFYWFDYNNSLITTEANKTGIDTWSLNSSWASAHYRLFDMYISTGYNESYKGIYVLEIRTSTYNQYQPFTPIVGNHIINISMSLLGASYSTEYTEAFFTINLTILPINTNLSITQYSLFSGTEISEPIAPWGGSAYYMGVYLNYTTDDGTFISNPENVNVTFNNGTHDLMWGNNLNTLKRFTYDLRGLHFVKLFTLTDDSIANPWINNFKNFTITITFNRSNHALVNVTFEFSISQHKTYIENIQYHQTVKYLTERLINFFYIDSNATETSWERNISDFNIYCNWTGFNYDEIVPGTYLLHLPGNHAPGIYTINLTLTDNLTYNSRSKATILLNLTVIQANVTLYDDFSYQLWPTNQYIYQGFAFTYQTNLKDEYGNGIGATVVWKLYYGNDLVGSGFLAQVSPGVYKADILVPNILSDSHKLIIEVIPNDSGYAGYTKEYVIYIYPFYSHPLFISLMAIIAGVVGFGAYQAVKWWRTPYVVKTIIRTEKNIKKSKDIELEPTVKSRRTLFKERFDDFWESMNLKVPEMVSMDIIEARKILSDVKRTRITVNETIAFLDKIKSMESVEKADKFLEKQFIPPIAREKILDIAGLAKTENPEIVELVKKLNEIKVRTYTYEEGEELYYKLKSLSPIDADDYILKNFLISEDQRDYLLRIVRVPFDKTLRKKRAKGLQLRPMTSTEIKHELRKITTLNLMEKKSEHDRILNLDPSMQRKYIKSLIEKHTPKKVEEKPKVAKIKMMTEEEIIAELNKIPGLSDDNKIMYLETLSLLPEKSQRKSLKALKDAATGKKITAEKEKTEEVKGKSPEKPQTKKPEKEDKMKLEKDETNKVQGDDSKNKSTKKKKGGKKL
ncbi:MAG: hypothetical protein EAX96_08005 [Candidatus Lokiarchaeota archaeon]|nr:hypothetical protein [Candidatus Lokiarchaeota archaeon]